MEDKQTREGDSKNPAEQPSAGAQPINPQGPVPPVPMTSVGDTGNAEIHQPTSENNARPRGDAFPHPPEPRIPPPNDRWMTRLTAIIAFATAINVIVFYLESESTSKQIDKLTDKAGEIVDSMNTALSDSREAISKAFGENKAALDAGQKQSKAALDASIEAFRNDERAWVATSSFDKTNLEIGKPFMIRFIIKNTGKSPARVRSVTIINPVKKGELPDLDEAPNDPVSRQGIIAPQGAYRLEVDGTKDSVLTQSSRDAITSGQLTIYVYGTICYSDVFRRDHWTEFCDILNPKTLEFDVCATHNEMDSDKPTKPPARCSK